MQDDNQSNDPNVDPSNVKDMVLHIGYYVFGVLIFWVICFTVVFLVIAALVQLVLLLPLGIGDEQPVSWIPVTVFLSGLVATFCAFRAARDEYFEFSLDVKDLKKVVKRMLPW